MKNSGTFNIIARGDREIVVVRVFDAPRRLVFDAYTKPDLIKKWLLGPDDWSMPVCEIDLRAGGKYRYVWKDDSKGTEMGMGGIYREVVPGERIVATEIFDEAWYPGEAVDTIVLTEQDGKTTLTQTIVYNSRATRDAVLKIKDMPELLATQPALARSIRQRVPYLGPLNHLQIQLLRRSRAGVADDDVRLGIHLIGIEWIIAMLGAAAPRVALGGPEMRSDAVEQQQ